MERTYRGARTAGTHRLLQRGIGCPRTKVTVRGRLPD
jgi:hypothetical protein